MTSLPKASFYAACAVAIISVVHFPTALVCFAIACIGIVLWACWQLLTWIGAGCDSCCAPIWRSLKWGIRVMWCWPCMCFGCTRRNVSSMCCCRTYIIVILLVLAFVFCFHQYRETVKHWGRMHDRYILVT